MTSSKMWAFLMLVIPVVCMTEDSALHVRTNYKPYEDTWEDFKTKFGRSYSGEEESLRYKAFVSRVQHFESHNQDFLDHKVSFSKDINKFTDRLDNEVWNSCHVDEEEEDEEDEEEETSGGRRRRRQAGYCTPFSPPANFTPPERLDWREDRIVSPVGNQGEKCGSCFAYGVTTTITAQLKLKMREEKLIPMSEQQLVDCFAGCDGNNAEASFEYISGAGGIMSAEDYPDSNQTFFEGVPEQCAFSASKAKAAVCGCLFSQYNETNLLYMVASKGPVYVSMAVYESFQDLQNGIFELASCNNKSSKYQGRHCVTVVGYGIDLISDTEYWIIKNSWGTDWGVHGYGLIERGTNACGIGDRITVPVVVPAGKSCDYDSSDGALRMSGIASWPAAMIPLSLVFSFIIR